MSEKELDYFKILAGTLMGAAFVVMVETDEEFYSILEEREDLIIMSLHTRTYARSQNSVIEVMGEAETVGASWIWPVDMVLIGEETSEEYLKKSINAWLPRLIDKGIFAFLHYEEEGFDHVKRVVDRKMKDYEPIAHAGTLRAYRITDSATAISWKMIEKSYEKHGVLQH